VVPRVASNPEPRRPAIFEGGLTTALLSDAGEWDFHFTDTADYLHTLHPWPAKFIPHIPRKAILDYTQPDGTVLDPFMGCGTTLLEARQLGRRSIGVDNNAVAVLISRAKTAAYKGKDVARLRELARALPQRLGNLRARPDLTPESENFGYWFPRDVVARLAALKGLILDEQEPLRTLLLAALSSIVVRVSYQDSDTRYKRVDREISPRAVDRAFGQRLDYLIAQLPTTLEKQTAPVQIYQGDARDLQPIVSNSVDLVVTSPPYLNAYDYHKYHRQRLHLIDGDVAFARDVEIGKHDDFTRPGATPDRYFHDMDICFSEWARVMRPGAKCVLLIGDAIVSKHPVPVADRFVELLEAHGVALQKRWVRELQATRRSFNVKNSRISHEHVLLLEKG
jgi:site-specific DNA-methyltransferase (cytosine-N4-specific)